MIPVIHRGERYVACASMSQNAQVKSAGFRWDKKAREWWTADWRLASILDPSIRPEPVWDAKRKRWREPVVRQARSPRQRKPTTGVLQYAVSSWGERFQEIRQHLEWLSGSDALFTEICGEYQPGDGAELPVYTRLCAARNEIQMERSPMK